MARKIFYARRSKRPLIMTLGVMCLCAGAFYSGFAAGRGHPNLFVFMSADVLPVSQAGASNVAPLQVPPVKLAAAAR